MQLQIVSDEKGTPSFDDTLSRINVILGTNGSGKSKLLNALDASTKSQPDFEFKVVRVTASRRGNLPSKITTQTNAGKSFDDFDEEVREGFTGVNTEALGRMQEALNHFSTSLASEQVEYRKRHLEWMAEGGKTGAPTIPEDRKPEAHLEKLLSLFSEIFPEISIRAKNFEYAETSNVNNMTPVMRNRTRVGFVLELEKLKDVPITGKYSFDLTCFKNGQEFSPAELSDGEKQILTLLADRYFFKLTKCLFLVDEPELNLDPVLAIKYWNLIEREMADSIFVYTTHSLDFALRDNVDRIWSLGKGEARPIPLDKLGGLPEDEQRRFLSGIRGIITTDKGLVVEGTESSFDTKFYPWILGDKDNEFQISGYGSCNDVQAATRKLDIWQRMVPTSNILGIVDADYKTQEELRQLADSECISLELHDAESFLCHPAVLIDLAGKLGRTPFPTSDQLLDEIVAFLDETILDICHHRLARRCRASVQISLRSEVLDQVADLDELKVKLGKVAQTNAGSDFGLNEMRVNEILNEEYRRCLTAKSKKNVAELLNLVKGKDLLARFSSHFGLANGLEVMNYVSAHLAPDAFGHTRALREQIQARFSTSVEAGPAEVACHPAHTVLSTPAGIGEVQDTESVSTDLDNKA